MKKQPEISIKAQEKIMSFLSDDCDGCDIAKYIGDIQEFNVFVAERSDGKAVFSGPPTFFFVNGDDVREIVGDEPENSEALQLLQ